MSIDSLMKAVPLCQSISRMGNNDSNIVCVFTLETHHRITFLVYIFRCVSRFKQGLAFVKFLRKTSYFRAENYCVNHFLPLHFNYQDSPMTIAAFLL